MIDLTGLATEWGERLLLHRAHQGEVRIRDGGYVLGERPIIGHLATVLDALLDGGLLTVDSPDPDGGQRVRVTDLGQARAGALRYIRPHGTVCDPPESRCESPESPWERPKSPCPPAGPGVE